MPRRGLPTRLRQHCTKRRAARRRRRPRRRRSRSRSRSVNGRFLDLALRLPDELRGARAGAARLLTARFKRGKIELRLDRRRRAPRARWPSRRPSSSTTWRALESTVRGSLPQARRALGPRGAAVVPRRAPTRQPDARRRSTPPRRCVDGLREARAREGERLAAVLARARRPPARARRRRPSRWCPAAVARQQQRFLERWNEALDKRRRGAVDRARGDRGARPQRSGGLRDPHRRRRGAGAPALAPRRDRAPARQGRRDRQAPRVPDPGAAARGQHARLEVAVDRDDRRSRST